MRNFVRGMPVAAAVLVLGWAASASAVTFDWVMVGNPGNAADSTGYGAVAEVYRIAETEVTNAQYAEFLNAKAGASDPLALYDQDMDTFRGGITKSGATYSTTAGRGAKPVNFVSFYDTLRFANWLHNGQGSGDTEDGAYTLLGGTAIPSNGATVTRNAGANAFLTSEDEWYKAAYHNALGVAATDYFDYPAGFDAQTTCDSPNGATNQANCERWNGDLTDVGSYTSSASPHGTFDQGGNVWEWNEAINSGSNRRGIRGGAFDIPPDGLAASWRGDLSPNNGSYNIGFRVASRIRGLLTISTDKAVYELGETVVLTIEADPQEETGDSVRIIVAHDPSALTALGVVGPGPDGSPDAFTKLGGSFLPERSVHEGSCGWAVGRHAQCLAWDQLSFASWAFDSGSRRSILHYLVEAEEQTTTLSIQDAAGNDFIFVDLGDANDTNTAQKSVTIPEPSRPVQSVAVLFALGLCAAHRRATRRRS